MRKSYLQIALLCLLIPYILALTMTPYGGPDWNNVAITGGTIDGATFKMTDVDTIPINVCRNGSSGPAALSTLTSTYSVDVRDFAGTGADEDVYCDWEVPNDFTGSTVTFRVVGWVTNGTGPSTEGVAFFLQGASVADGELLSSTHGTAVKSSFADESHAQYDRVTTDYSGAVTITGIAAGETAILKLYRDISDADDDYEQDFGVAKIQIKYDRNMVDD